MKSEILPGISRSDYLKIDATNISTLIEGERSMAHLKYAMEHQKESTPAMEKGTALHLAVFEPAEFERRVAVFDGIRRGKEWESFKSKSLKNSITVKPDDFDDVISMRDELHRHPRVKELFDSQGTGEMGMVWQDVESGLWCKGLIDRFCACWGYSIVLDLKTCQDSRAAEFSKTVYNYSYHTKAMFYMDGLSAIKDVSRRFLWIAIESTPHHGIVIHDIGEGMMQAGRRNYRRLLNQFAECKKTNIWPSYPLGEETLELPRWA